MLKCFGIARLTGQHNRRITKASEEHKNQQYYSCKNRKCVQSSSDDIYECCLHLFAAIVIEYMPLSATVLLIRALSIQKKINPVIG